MFKKTSKLILKNNSLIKGKLFRKSPKYLKNSLIVSRNYAINIGIDLGTTNSCVSYVDNGVPKVIPNEEGHNTTPSIVAFTTDGESLVGVTAKRQAVTNPLNTIYAAKRLIGRRYDDPLTEEDKKHVPFKIVPSDNGDAWIEIRGKKYSPSQIGAMILRKLKNQAETSLSSSVSAAVITVPAYFNDSQRKATKDAGLIAGLNVARIINEPTAAALAFGFKSESKKGQTIAVYDLGGGTFDISILEIQDGVFEVLATNGDTFLGGEDFDITIMNYLIDQFKKAHSVDLTGETIALQRLREAAEKAKCELSNVETTEINLPYLLNVKGEPKHLQVKLSRKDYENMITPLVQRTITPVEKCLKDSKLSKGDINEVLLVGGMIRTPLVQRTISKFFGKEPNKGVNPDEAVSMGAALQASVLSGELVAATDSQIVLIDVTPLSLGTSLHDGSYAVMINRNTAIPCSSTKQFTTAVDGQTSITVEILQGERPIAKLNKVLGQFVLDGIIPAPKGVPKIEMTFGIDANGIVTATAKDVNTGKEQSCKVQSSGGLSESEIERMIKEAEMNSENDKKLKEKKSSINEAESALNTIESDIAKYSDKLNSNDVNQLLDKISSLKEEIKQDKLSIDDLRNRTDSLKRESYKLFEQIYQQGNQQNNQQEQK
eukprot:TRINITY_DN16699_c0_g1_i1.p1 TRINITY_DN16699_c0_g1~~TRINITY_DN16699_c0_g1_i1.p1  ORF type:complete len:658 (-),score=235.26 TRINITY_DN16699_c0_g1_i1:36-2009(-)